MLIGIRAQLLYSTPHPCDVLLQIEALSDDVQICEHSALHFPEALAHTQISAEDDLGTRRWVQSGPTFDCTYTAQVALDRDPVAIDALQATRLADLSGAATKYLMPSRYCQPDAFLDFVPHTFGALTGGALIAAMSEWIKAHFTYDNGASNGQTTAQDSFAKRAGVCRDYAHVLISMARGAGIPARFVSVYAPDVIPQDFHAVVEVYLDGAWHLVDPTGMANPAEMVRIGVGRDAAETSFMTSYGWMTLKKQSVEVWRIA